MNESFDTMMSVITDDESLKKTRKLQNFNLIDVGIISDVTEDGRCSVDSFKIINNINVKYTSLELVFPGGFGTLSVSGMFGLVLFPAPITDLENNTVTETRDYFTASGGKVIPIGLYNEDSLKTGFDIDGRMCIYGDGLQVTMSGDTVNVDIAAVENNEPIYGGAASIFADKEGVNISMCKGSILYQSSVADGSEIIAHVANGRPFYFEKRVGETRWVGHNSYKTFQQRQYDLSNFVKEDFLFVEYFINTERWVYVYKDDGSTYCAMGLDNTGIIDIETEGNITVTRKGNPATVLEIKNNKVSITTEDLEISGKVTVTGMKVDLQKFLDDLTSALNAMYTLGSPATHQTDGGFKSNIAALRSKL